MVNHDERYGGMCHYAMMGCDGDHDDLRLQLTRVGPQQPAVELSVDVEDELASILVSIDSPPVKVFTWWQ